MNSSENSQQPVHWLYRPENRPKLWMALAVVVVIPVIAQLFFPLHGWFSLDDWFGFNAVYGFLSCAAMVLFAKLLGLWLKRPEGYYDND